MLAYSVIFCLSVYILADLYFTLRQRLHRRRLLAGANGLTIRRVVEETGTPIERFTCYDCPLAHKCRSAFDPYNTDGDCLEAK